MIIDIVKFEMGRHLKRPSTYIYFIGYAFLSFMFTLLSGGAFESVRLSMDNSNILVNGAYSITAAMGSLGVIGLITVAAFMGQVVYQDFHHRMHSLVFVKPVSKLDYLAGRFVGTFAIVALIFLSLPIAAYVAGSVGMIPATALGEHHFWYYMTPYFSFVMVNILWAGAIFFTLAALFRQMMPVYIGSLLLVLFWAASAITVNAPGDASSSTFIDPFGLQAAEDTARYWTITEKNNQLLALAGDVLLNRLLWLAIGALMLLWCYRRFDFVEALSTKKMGKKGGKKATKETTEANTGQISAKASYGSQLFTAWSLRQAFFALVKLELWQTLKNRYFVVLMAAAVGFIFFAADNVGNTFGTQTYPTTYMITDILGGGFQFFILIVIVFYAGELVWREKDVGIKQVADAMPVPASFAYFSKFIALMSVVLLMLLMVAVAGVIIQVSGGYFEFDWHVYFVELLVINFSRALLLGALAIFIQTLVGNKYAGHAVMVAIYMLTTFMPQMGVDSLLLRFAAAPEVMYSDMNGYGTYLAPHFWFKAYWLAFAVILMQLSMIIWPRGEETRWGNRLKNARNSLNGNWRTSLTVSGLTFAALAVFLGYNTLVVNPVLSSDQRAENSVSYERDYRAAFENLPQPSIANADFTVDIYANSRSLKLAGTYKLKNEQQQPLSKILLNLPQMLNLVELSMDRQYVENIDDEANGVKVLTLDKALLPGEQSELSFTFEFSPQGVSAQRKAARIFQNGTFLDIEYFPVLGFDRRRMLQSAIARTRFNLGTLPELPGADDPQAVMRNGFGGDTRWANSSYQISTDKGQTAISPGELVKHWTEGDREHFSYQSKRATIFFPAVVSARYTVKEAKWNDVAIQVFHHERHAYNVDTMIRGVQQSLAVFTKEFGEYPFDHVRIIEFPRFSRFAQSYPGTIPYSEAIGFVAKLSEGNKDEVNYPFFVTAHEMAHQWWPHQTAVSATKGANMLSETLAQYSALIVMEHDLGSEAMRLLLRYGLDRYLGGRGAERDKEVPLVEADDRNYIMYDKGGIVMYALRDYIGAETLHQILRNYLNEFKYAEAGQPYPTSAGLVSRIKQNIAVEYQYLVADLFENITLMDMRATQATVAEVEDKFEVTITGSVNKNRLSEVGDSETIAMNDLIDVALFDQQGEVIYLQKHRFSGGDFELMIRVDSQSGTKPVSVGIDPYHKLIDRVPDDNRVGVTSE